MVDNTTVLSAEQTNRALKQKSRRSKAGRIIALAPNFDNNLSLISVDPTLSNKDGFITVFKKFLTSHPIAYELYKKIKLPLLDENKIKTIMSTIPIKVDEDKIITYVLERYYKVIKL